MGKMRIGLAVEDLDVDRYGDEEQADERCGRSPGEEVERLPIRDNLSEVGHDSKSLQQQNGDPVFSRAVR